MTLTRPSAIVGYSRPSSPLSPEIHMTPVTGRRPVRASAFAGSALICALTLGACVDSPTDPFSAIEVDDPRFSVTTTSLDIWHPFDGEWVTGLHLIKAAYPSRALSTYKMSWQVDGGSLVTMNNSEVGGPHKEAYIDFTNWRWNGSGPYLLNFVARDRQTNQLLGTRSVRIWIGKRPNPFAGARFYVDPNSNAKQQADAWRVTRAEDASAMDRIASQSQADWLGNWIPDVYSHVNARTSTIVAAGALPVFVAYNIPVRDCNSYSAGGATSADAYRSWIRAVANGIGSRRAVVILEPDALGLLECLTTTEQQIRIDLINDAVQVLRSKGNIFVYIDAGNGRWHPDFVMADRLTRAGVARADGFALNISNYITTSDNATYGTSLSGLLGGKRFIIDTSRNGNGPTADLQWCNPDGRSLGAASTANTGHPLIDAFYWIKRPGESDGECNGGPSAGSWWAEYALGLAKQSMALVAMQ